MIGRNRSLHREHSEGAEEHEAGDYEMHAEVYGGGGWNWRTDDRAFIPRIHGTMTARSPSSETFETAGFSPVRRLAIHRIEWSALV